MQNNYDSESRRSSRCRALERSISYSEAIGNSSARSSIEIPRMVNTDAYTNEELLKQYRISQSYVEGKEITFPYISNTDTKEIIPSIDGLTSHYSSEDDGLVMTIDEDSPKTSDLKQISELFSPAVEDDYDRIEMMDFDDTTTAPTPGYSTPYSKRKRKDTHRRRHGRPNRSRRVVFKDGEENVPVRSHISSKSMKYMRDIVNTVVRNTNFNSYRFNRTFDISILTYNPNKWRFLLMLMVVTHFVFWLVFAAIWYAVTTSYADDIGDGKEHCVTGTSSFAGLLMMSVETQMTIGYGTRYPNEECPEAIIIMVIEIVAGTALSGGLSSLLFTKLIRPNRHVSSVGFSKKATVCLRDGELCLQFRVWDFMNVHMIGSSITAYMMKPIRTLEGEIVKNYIHQLKLKEARAFLLWPITVVHVINAESPMYDLSAQDCMDYRFEIVVCLQGSSKNMGTVTQSRTSYLSKEIIWGYRFKNVLHYSKKNEAYEIDDANLNTVEQVETPLCSASRLKEFETDIKSSTNILTPTEMSTPTNMSVCHEESVPSTPSLNRAAGTQRSFGWNFRRFYPERYINTEATLEERIE